MKNLIPILAIALVACGRQPDPALVDNAADAGLVSANAQNDDLKRQARTVTSPK